MFKTINTFFIGILVLSPFFVFAQSSSTLEKNIEEKTAEIKALQEEIAKYQNQVNQINTEAKTLQGALQIISKDQKVLQTNLSLTNKKVDRANLTITQNERDIQNLGSDIVSNTIALKETIRALHENDQRSLLELIASGKTVSDFLGDVDQIIKVQTELKANVKTMRVTKGNLEASQISLEKQKKELQALKDTLADQKKIVDSQVAEKNNLLKQTKQQESQYQALLLERQKQVAALEAEIFQYESQLKFTLDAGSLPVAGSVALGWPLDDILITQRFGKTVDARRLYVSGSHSGADFRAAVGTPVYATADGVVEGTGDTDTVCYKASFGKWVFIKHTNGLSTVSAHLSLIKAVKGQHVSKGDLIGYSGNTGHSTGPHLHLTVLASNGVNGEEGARVAQRPSVNPACKGRAYTMPIAPTSAYLDPLLYLPKTAAFKN